jgi:hypothetical protein
MAMISRPFIVIAATVVAIAAISIVNADADTAGSRAEVKTLRQCRRRNANASHGQQSDYDLLHVRSSSARQQES